MMFTGMMSVVLNWNPLMKLDGYYILCDLAGIQDIKEKSTAFTCLGKKNSGDCRSKFLMCRHGELVFRVRDAFGSL